MEVLAEKLVTFIATKRGISKPQAVKYINKCLTKVSAQENIAYDALYKTFYTFAGMATCLAGSCSKVEIEDCEKMCHCVIFKNKCVPRYLPNAMDINQDPDKWVKGKTQKELEQLVEYASYLYYNYDGGGLTDNAFDALEHHLNKKLKLKGRRWEKIGSEPVDKLKTKLPYPMASLDKIKPGEKALLPFLGKAKEHGMVWSNKLDGVSGMVVFKDGKVTNIYTRGDGAIGGDVTYLKDYISLPKPSGKYLVVRGEFILSKKVWEEKYKGVYATARSFVSAKINSGFISPALPDIQFVAYQIVDWDKKDQPPPSQTFRILRELGFLIPDHGTFKKGRDLLAFEVVTKYKDQRTSSSYTIDGLVLALDVPQPLKQLANPEFTKAFKMTLEEQLRSSKVINVDWNITRHGRYFPVAIFEAVYIDDIRIHRASAHNAAHINDWHMGIGTKIVVARSGDVIPTIKDVTIDENITAIMPGSTYEWYWAGKDIVLKDIEGNPEVQIQRITHFFETIQTPQLGEGRVRKMYTHGFTTLQAITSASAADLKKIPGFGPKLSTGIYENIHRTMRNTRLDRYFVAITTFRTNIGRKTLMTVIRYYPQVLSASSQEILAHLSKKENKIPGIGPAKIKGLAESVPKFREILMKLSKDDIEYAIKHQEEKLGKLKKSGYNHKIKGKIFVTTGFIIKEPYDLEDYIWDHWGDLSSTVTSNTTAVISGNIANITGKMLKANELGVPVYTVEEFQRAFDAAF